MILAANVFSSVVNSLESDTRRGAGGHRREPRVLLSTRVTIMPCPQGLESGLGAPLSVPVRDLSRGGLRFLLPRRWLPLDTQFVALLPGGAGWPTANGPERAGSPVADVPAAAEGETTPEQTMAVLCGVAYWQPLAKDLFAIGGHFIQAIPNFAVPGVAPRVVLPGEIEGEAPPTLGPSHDATPIRRVAS